MRSFLTGEGSAAPAASAIGIHVAASPSRSATAAFGRTRHGFTSSVKWVNACSKGSSGSTAAASRP